MILAVSSNTDLFLISLNWVMMINILLQVFAVGVGSGVDKSELNAIATNPDSTHVLTVKDFNQLTQITAQLNNKACAGKWFNNH